MQIRLIVRSKGGDETYEKGDRDEYGFCCLLLPTASLRVEGSSVNGVRYLPARFSFPVHVSSMNGGRGTD